MSRIVSLRRRLLAWRGLAAALLLPLLLAACSGGGFFSAPQTGTPILVTINAAGAGPVNGSTSYSSSTLRSLLPGYEVSGITIATETQTRSAFGVYANGTLLLQILSSGSRIGAIHGVGLYVAGPNGERIGQTFAEVRPVRSTCRIGRGSWIGLPICQARGNPNILLVFAVTGATTTSFPSESVLQQAVLTRIVWEPA